MAEAAAEVSGEVATQVAQNVVAADGGAAAGLVEQLKAAAMKALEAGKEVAQTVDIKAAVTQFVEGAKGGDVVGACKELLGKPEGRIILGGSVALLLALGCRRCGGAAVVDPEPVVRPQEVARMTLTPIDQCAKKVPVDLLEVVDQKGRRIVVASDHTEPFDIPIGTKVDEVNGVIVNTVKDVRAAVDVREPTATIELLLGKQPITLAPQVEEEEEERAPPIRQSRKQSLVEEEFLRQRASTSETFVAVTLSPAREDLQPGAPPAVLLTSGNPASPGNRRHRDDANGVPPLDGEAKGDTTTEPAPAADAPAPVEEKAAEAAPVKKSPAAKPKKATSAAASTAAAAKPARDINRVRKVVTKKVPVKRQESTSPKESSTVRRATSSSPKN